MFNRSIAEEHKWRAAELDHNVGIACRHALSGAKVEGNICPPPIVDHQLYGDECFCARVGSDIRFVAVCRLVLAVYDALSVLSTDRAGENFLIAERLNRMQYFRLLVPHSIGVERNGRLHRS